MDLVEVVEWSIFLKVVGDLMGVGACVLVLEVCEAVVVELDLELFSLVLAFPFDRLREVTGLILEDEVTVLGVMGDGTCRLACEAVIEELALSSLLDEL